MILTMLAVTVTALPLGSSIATQQVLPDVGRILAPLGWGICAYVAVVLVVLLATIAVEAWWTRASMATQAGRRFERLAALRPTRPNAAVVRTRCGSGEPRTRRSYPGPKPMSHATGVGGA
jgi:hypothetical protein